MDCILCKKPIRGIGFIVEPVETGKWGFERLHPLITPEGLHRKCRARIKRGVNAEQVLQENRA